MTSERLGSGNPGDQSIAVSELFAYNDGHAVPLETPAPKKKRAPRKTTKKPAEVAASTPEPVKLRAGDRIPAHERYSQRMTPDREAKMEQARIEYAQDEARRFAEWNEKRANGQTLENDVFDDPAENEKNFPKVRSIDEAFDQIMSDRARRDRLQQFHAVADGILASSKYGKRAFMLADQAREARAEFDRLLNEGEYDENAYREQVIDRENNLQDVLMKYGDSLSQEQQDFLIDFAGGEYDDLLVPAEAPADPSLTEQTQQTVVNPRHQALRDAQRAAMLENGMLGTENEINNLTDEELDELAFVEGIWDKAAPAPAAASDEQSQTPNESASTPAPTTPDSIKTPRDRGFVGAYGDNPRVPDERALMPAGENDEPYWAATWPKAAAASGESQAESESFIGPRKFNIEALLAEANPDVLEKYSQARQAYIDSQITARSGIGSIIDRIPRKFAWVEKLREKHSSSNDAREKMAKQEYEAAYLAALTAAHAEWGKLVTFSGEKEREEARILLEAEEAELLERDITAARISASGSKSSASKLAYGVKAVAASFVLGATTGLIDGPGRGGSDHLGWMTVGGVLGGVAGGYFGYKAAKESDADELTDEALESRISEARDTIRSNYASSDTPLDERVEVLNAVGDNTNRIQNKKLGGAVTTAAGILLGAGIGLAGHRIADMYSGDLVGNAKDFLNSEWPGNGTPETPNVDGTGANRTGSAVREAVTVAPTPDMPTPPAGETGTGTVVPGDTPPEKPAGNGNGTEKPVDLTISNHETETTTPDKGPATEPTTTTTPVTETEPILPLDPTEGLNDTFDVEYGNGVTQEMEQTFKENGIPVPSDEKMAAMTAEGVEKFGPSGIIEGVTLELSPDGTEYWIPEPVQDVKWTPEYLDFITNNPGK